VLRAIPSLGVEDVIRGQVSGYRNEPGVAPESQTETFATLRLFINSWRWQGVPFFIRAGKSLPVTCTEVVGRLRAPPAVYPQRKSGPNHVRFRISPDTTVAMGLTVMDEEEAGVGQATELEASRHAGPNEMDAYERLLGDALVGDQGLFAREDYVEEAWRIVEPVLKPNVLPQPGIYAPGTWGVSSEALTPPGGWHNPVLEEQPG